MKVTVVNESHEKFRNLKESKDNIVKYRILKTPNGRYRIQYQHKRFMFFGKLVWSYVENLGESPWDSDNIEEAKESIRQFESKSEVVFET